MRAEILSWSRSQGLFAGLALEGATLRQDLDDNETLYGKKLENRQIVTTGVVLHEGDGAARALFETTALSDYARLNEERAGILDDIRRRGTIHG